MMFLAKQKGKKKKKCGGGALKSQAILIEDQPKFCGAQFP